LLALPLREVDFIDFNRDEAVLGTLHLEIDEDFWKTSFIPE
jgi:hypothetical protein